MTSLYYSLTRLEYFITVSFSDSQSLHMQQITKNHESPKLCPLVIAENSKLSAHTFFLVNFL